MDGDELAERLKAFRIQVSTSSQRAKRKSRSHRLPVSGDDSSLDLAFEELQVAEEQLRRQNDELTAAQQTLAAERKRYQDLFEFAPDGYIVTDQHGVVQEANQTAVTMLNSSRRLLVGKPLITFISGESRHTYREQLSKMRTASEVRSSEVRLQPRKSPLIDVLLTVDVIYSPEGGRIGLRWLLHDITERKLAEGKTREHNQQLRVLNTIVGTINTTLELPAILETLRKTLVEQLNIPGGAILLYEQDQLLLQASWGLDRPQDLAIADSTVKHNGRRRPTPPETYPDAAQRLLGGDDWASWRSVLCCPLALDGKTQGFIDLFRHEPDAFDEEQIAFFQLFSQHVGIAVKNARLFAEVRREREQSQKLSRRLVEVQEEERHHVARELHDQIGQALTGLKLSLEAIQYLAPDGSKQRLTEAQSLANELIGQVRNLSLDLRPAMLDDLGLVPALRWHFRRYTSQTGIQVSFEHRGMQRRFPGEIETTAYRILQEALTNVARHAKVNEVEVTIWADQQTLYLEVVDQGTGFDPLSLHTGSSSGVSGMQERAALLGGRLAIKSAEGSGTCLLAELPLATPANPDQQPDKV